MPSCNILKPIIMLSITLFSVSHSPPPPTIHMNPLVCTHTSIYFSTIYFYSVIASLSSFFILISHVIHSCEYVWRDVWCGSYYNKHEIIILYPCAIIKWFLEITHFCGFYIHKNIYFSQLTFLPFVSLIVETDLLWYRKKLDVIFYERDKMLWWWRWW